MNKMQKLDKRNIEDILSLTKTQEGLLFHYRSSPESKQYHEQLSLRLEGDIKLHNVQKAWDFVIESNEMLRTIYMWENLDNSIQIVLKKHKVPVKYYDFSLRNHSEKKLEELKKWDIDNRIDISMETIRITLCKLAEYQYEMIISNHHILYDGWSNGILIKEFLDAYYDFHRGEEPKQVRKTKFKEFIKKSKLHDKTQQKEYWENYMKDLNVNDSIFMNIDENKDFKDFKYELSNELTKKIKDFSKTNNISLAAILYSSWGLMLQQLNNCQESLFGTTVSGRNSFVEGIDNIVGLFINTVPFRLKTSRSERLNNIVKRTHDYLIEREEYDSTPIIDIKEYSNLKDTYNIFDSIVVIENYPLDLNKCSNEVISINDYSIVDFNNYSMTLSITTFENITLTFNYNNCIVSEEHVKSFSKYMCNILNEIIENPNKKICDLDILSSKEKNQILNEFNDTYYDYPKHKVLHELFEEQVERTPNKIALVYGENSLTYRTLNERANSLAETLRKEGVGPDVIVGIMAERSFEMIIGIMAILKAGGAYLPISPEYPKDRIKYMIEDSDTNILLVQNKYIEKCDIECRLVDLNEEKSYSSNIDNLDKINNPNNLAYVIYTSGSTGKPKGVMIENSSVINRLSWMQNKYPLNSDDVILQKTTYTFDVSVWELFWWSLVGARVCLLEQGREKDPEEILNSIKENKVTTIHFVPSMLNIFNDYIINLNLKDNLDSLKWLFTSGEALGKQCLLNFQKKINKDNRIQVVNLYGPTEATVDVTYYNCSSELNTNSIPIGKPIDNTKIYIVDKYNRIQPIGFPGELCIAGDGVARGYLNNEELSKSKFIDNPFISGRKLYKTGDLARWLSDGNIEFLGRIDNQVKIRGFRIELGEIEDCLLKIEGIKRAVVIDREDHTGSKYLCAYLVSDLEITLEKLKGELSKILPDYMIPAYFMRVDNIPLSTNGKINKKELPEPHGNVISRVEYQAPRNQIEEKLINIWSEILKIDNIGVNDNFFELGGHSLKVTRLVTKIHKVLGVKVTIKQIFEYPTIREISDIIKVGELDKKQETIKSAEKKKYYAVSAPQKRMFMLQQLELGSVNYNMPGSLTISGKLNVDKLEDSINELIKRHEILRTSFSLVEDEVVQIISDRLNIKIENIKDNNWNIEDINKKIVRPFNLSELPLLRIGILKIAEDEHILLLDMHHIISDGVSIGILIRELASIYDGNELEELKIQYKDFAEWQNIFLDSENVKKQEDFWLKNFSDDIPKLNMPLDYSRPVIQSFEGESLNFKLDKKLKGQLSSIASDTGASMFMVLLSGINILISKYTGQEDILIGTPVAGRTNIDIDKTIGVFVNTLVMRNYPTGSKTYQEFLYELKNNVINAFDNQDYQFEDLVDKLNINRDMTRNPIFDVMFSMENMDKIDLNMKELTIRSYKTGQNVAKFDMNFTVKEIEEELVFNIEYCTKLFKQETVKRMSKHLLNIFNVIVENRDINICDIEMISAKEKFEILEEFNNNNTDYPRDKMIHHLFEEQVERNPEKIAVVYDGQQISYRELNRKANKLGRYLITKGVKSDSIVGIYLERSIDIIVSVIGILKAGGAYMPIDIDYPDDRIEFMINDSNLDVLLAKGEKIPDINFIGEIIDLENQEINKLNCENIKVINNPKNLAYVIYTSGSTGKPKGVMIENQSVVRLVINSNYIKFEKKDKILQTGTLSFDACTFEIWGALLNGLELHIGNKNLILDSLCMERYIKNNDITILWLSAPLFGVLANERHTMFESLRYLLVGGDVLPVKFINDIRRRYENLKIINGYGPTENTTFSTCFLIDKEYSDSIPIGKPISNSKAYILDKYKKVQPLGVYGELFVGGDGLARGYLNNYELTKEKFIENHFINGERMYKTGDIVRWLPEGNIEFLGRIDNQVKIRGFRIEIDEIEKNLERLQNIKEAVVIDYKDQADIKYLCAYLVSEIKLDLKNIKYKVSKKLPDYMIPLCFMQVDEIPLNLNGKIDRHLLPIPNKESNITAQYEAPSNEIQQRLADIWRGLLNVKQIGIDDNFFEMGGHSLKATRLSALIHKEFDVEMPLSQIFKNSTIRGLSNYIRTQKESVYHEIKKVKKKDSYETSSAQKRMYMLQQFDIGGVNYNIPNVMFIKGNLDVKRFEKTFNCIINRHEALRTFFVMNDKLIQIINDQVDLKVEYIEKSNKDIQQIIEEFVRPFNLSEYPLLRVGLVKLKQNEHILIIDMHHIISDGVSMGILLREFANIYEGNELEELNIQYKDFAEWQNKLLESDNMKKQEEFWLKNFGDDIPILNMPLDFPRPVVQEFEGDIVNFKIDKNLTSKLCKIASDTQSTLYIILLSGINILLSKYSGQEDLIIGSPVAGRSHSDLEKIIGMFVNTLCMRNYPSGDKTYESFLNEVIENTVKAMENQDYQFEELVDKLNINRDPSRNPIFDVMFSMENMDIQYTEMKDLKLKAYKQKSKISKFDLTFSAFKEAEEIIMEIEYCTKLYKKESIEIMVEHFKNILKVITDNSKILLSDIEMITEKEKDIIINQFNDTDVEYSEDKTIHEIFEEQVIKTPDNIAVVYQNKKLTYGELNSEANKLASVLREKGVKPGTIVGMILGNSIEVMIGIMGVLKSGGAYLPIDSECPLERIQYMLEDSNAEILLINNKHSDKANFNIKILNLDRYESCEKSNTNLINKNKAEDLAYVIYTSGSTGKPKGVMIEHRNVVNLSGWYNRRYNIEKNKNVLQITNIAFDVAVLETILPVLNNGTVFIPNKEIFNKEEFREFVNKNKINSVQFVPATLNELIVGNEFMKSLSVLISGGDRLENSLRNKVISMGYELYNHYGPTETTVDTIVTKCDEKNIIGKPVDNSQVYILNESKKLQPINVPGEIYIGGDGVARGYLNRSKLSEEKFVQNPFIPGKRLYKSGDLGRFLPDGNIEFLGRIDYQVKIRGLRIELGEIENHLLNEKEIKEAIVIDRKNENGSKYLCAYIVSDKELTIKDIRERLSKNVPEYMIPSYFVQMESIPLTRNGKVNRKELPLPDRSIASGVEYEAPQNEVENILAEIWSKVLNTENISINDNFFTLGGDSLLLINMYKEIEKVYKNKVTVTDLFAYTTISKLADFIINKDEAKELNHKNLSFPEEYFFIDNIGQEKILLEFEVKDKTYEELVSISEIYKIEMVDLFLSGYIYLLSEVISQDTITIQTAIQTKVQNENSIASIEVDLSNIEEFYELSECICDKRKNVSREEVYVFEEINISDVIKKDCELLTLFCSDFEIKEKYLRVYDIIMNLKNVDNKRIVVSCEYNNARINRNKISEFMNAYIKILKAIIKKLKNK